MNIYVLVFFSEFRGAKISVFLTLAMVTQPQETPKCYASMLFQIKQHSEQNKIHPGEKQFSEGKDVGRDRHICV